MSTLREDIEALAEGSTSSAYRPHIADLYGDGELREVIPLEDLRAILDKHQTALLLAEEWRKHLPRIRAEAWDEGHGTGALDAANLAVWNLPPTPNPYRADQIGGDR